MLQLPSSPSLSSGRSQGRRARPPLEAVGGPASGTQRSCAPVLQRGGARPVQPGAGAVQRSCSNLEERLERLAAQARPRARARSPPRSPRARADLEDAAAAPGPVFAAPSRYRSPGRVRSARGPARRSCGGSPSRYRRRPRKQAVARRHRARSRSFELLEHRRRAPRSAPPPRPTRPLANRAGDAALLALQPLGIRSRGGPRRRHRAPSCADLGMGGAQGARVSVAPLEAGNQRGQLVAA